MFSSIEQFEQWFIKHRGKEEHYRNLLWSLIFRGDPAFLPRIKAFIKHDYEPTLAAYAVTHITGLDIDEEGLCIRDNDSEEQNPELKEHPDDIGLAKPDCDAIIAWLDKNENNLTNNIFCVAGQVLASSAQDIFISGSQPQRWQAALYLTLNTTAKAMTSLPVPDL